MRKIVILFLLIFYDIIPTQGQKKMLAPEELTTDVNFYFEKLHSLHPNPYSYFPILEFEEMKDKIYRQLKQPLTREQFSWIVGEINSYVERHSMIFYNQGRDAEEVNKVFESQAEVFFPPINIREGKIFLFDNEKDNIAEINGMSTDSIIADMKKYHNWRQPHSVNWQLMQERFSDIIFFQHHLKPPFRVKFSKSKKIHTIQGLSRGGIWKIVDYSHSRLDRAGKEAYSYKIFSESSIAIFHITTFLQSAREMFNEAYHSFSKAVNEQKIKYVFYDVSTNGGGHHYGEIALDIVRHDGVRLQCTKISRNGMAFVRKHKINELVLPPNYSKDIPEERKLFVLQGVRTASSGDYFCRVVAENKLGVLVGQPTGEPTIGFTSIRNFEMPYTKIPFMISTELLDFSEYFNSETLNPDIYWDVDHYRDFTEKELMDIVNKWEKSKK
jgi:hypothetical protein